MTCLVQPLQQFIQQSQDFSGQHVARSGDGSLICYYSLNNPVTDARYSGQLSESSSLIA